MKRLLDPRGYIFGFCAAFFLMVMVSCAQLGLPVAENFDQKAIAAQSTVTAIRSSAAQLLGSKSITAADGENALRVTDAAVEGITVARQLYATACPAQPCTSPAAEARLSVARSALVQLQAYLALRGSK